MSPFRRLGLRPDADAREVKRAYARLLKTTRPDDDAAAFQALNEAYQAALAMAGTAERLPAAAPTTQPAPIGDELPAIEPEPASTPPPDHHAPVAPVPLFDFGDFCRELADRCREGRAEALIGWLYSVEALYDIDLKQRVGHALHDWLLYDAEAPVPQAAQLEQLGTFFGLDFGHLERINAMRWAITHEQTSRYGESRPLAIRQLKRGFGWIRVLLLNAVPGMNRRIGTLAWRMAREAGCVPPGIDPRQYEWFTRLADDRFMGRARWLSIGSSAAVWMLATSALVGLLVLPGGEADATGVLGTALVLGAGFGSLMAATAVIRWLQALMASDGALGWRLGVGLPLVLAGLAAIGAGEGRLWPYAPALLAVILATRHWGRTFDALRLFLASLWPIQWGLGTVDTALMLALAAAASVLVGFDAAYALRWRLPFAASLANRWLRIGSYVAIGASLLLTALLGGKGPA